MGHCPSRSARGVTRHRAAGQLVTVRNSVSMPYYRAIRSWGNGDDRWTPGPCRRQDPPDAASFPSKTSLASVRRWWTSWSPSGTGWWVRTDPTRHCRGLYRWRTTRSKCARRSTRCRTSSGTRPVRDTAAVAVAVRPVPERAVSGEELLLGAAMLLIAAERLDHRAPGREQRHMQAVSATVPEVRHQ